MLVPGFIQHSEGGPPMTRHTRRAFLKQSAGLGLTLAGAGAFANKAVAANDKIAAACIGVRGQGGALLHAFAAQPDVVVTHICDIDESVRAKRGKEIEAKAGKAPKLLNDYRELLSDKSVDVFV